MADNIKLSFADQAGAVWADAIWRISEIHFNDLKMNGYMKIYIFASQAALNNLKMPYITKLELGTSEITQDGCTYGLKFTDVWGKSKAELRTLIKTKTLKIDGLEYDLSTGEDV